MWILRRVEIFRIFLKLIVREKNTEEVGMWRFDIFFNT